MLLLPRRCRGCRNPHRRRHRRMNHVVLPSRVNFNLDIRRRWVRPHRDRSNSDHDFYLRASIFPIWIQKNRVAERETERILETELGFWGWFKQLWMCCLFRIRDSFFLHSVFGFVFVFLSLVFILFLISHGFPVPFSTSTSLFSNLIFTLPRDLASLENTSMPRGKSPLMWVSSAARRVGGDSEVVHRETSSFYVVL